jgi:hypothetical protein
MDPDDKVSQQISGEIGNILPYHSGFGPGSSQNGCLAGIKIIMAVQYGDVKLNQIFLT